MEVISVDPPSYKRRQVEAELRRLTAAMAAGARLPAEQVLAEQYGCNRQTVRRALKALTDDGTVVRKAGRGVFVAGGAAAVADRVPAGRTGVLMWAAGSGIAGRVMAALNAEASAAGAELCVAWIGDLAGDAEGAAVSLVKQGCTALVVPWCPPGRAEELRVFVQSCPLPVRVVCGGAVDARYAEAVEGVIGYFRALGCARIAFVGPDAPGDMVLQSVLIRYACGVSREGIESQCHLVNAGGAQMELAARRCAQHAGAATAVIAYDDEHALRFMAAMRRLGLAAPVDFRIVGFGDIEAGHWSEPTLSTVSPDYRRAAAEVLSGGRAGAPSRLRFWVRGSCGGAGGDAGVLRAAAAGLDVILDGESEAAVWADRGPEDQAAVIV